ncbi:PREDICTED: putative F-box protein At3g20030 [Camelina sativa]|uniref:F-box protein At3g20030 n=1 Tax=Camelina sativa TaxID=90675 RepID=A0ABM0XRP8_CAMSA|nr:PREDICTED: putative F-box protein At3g20030 [Camelina sativa]
MRFCVKQKQCSIRFNKVLQTMERFIQRPFLRFMMMNYKLSSIRFDLYGKEFVDPSVKEIGNLINQVDISKVFHCDGLLLCVPRPRDNTSLVVWNPYLCQTRWIQPLNAYHRLDRYAIGYDNDRNHKILRFLDHYDPYVKHKFLEFEIFDLRSNSWRVLDISPGWEIEFYHRGVTLKGNTYFFAKEKIVYEGTGEYPEPQDYLLCFDFTAESFAQLLPLPFEHYIEDTGTLSYVKGEKLAALYQNMDTYALEIWVTTLIEPNAVSRSNFFKVDMKLHTGVDFKFEVESGSFFIDEEKKLAVVFDVDESESYTMAYIIGENGCLKEVNLGEAVVNLEESPYGRPIVSTYYVPTLAEVI